MLKFARKAKGKNQKEWEKNGKKGRADGERKKERKVKTEWGGILGKKKKVCKRK